MSFLNSINNNSKKFNDPFTHWELNKPLTEEQINEIVNADIANPKEHDLNYDGTRAIDGGEGKFRMGIADGGKALKFRCFVTKENSNNFPNLTKLINELQSNESEDLGTDFYDNNLNKVKTLPYKDNYGYFFSSGPNTWHGMEKKDIKKERRCLQVNYVTFKTDWKAD